MESATTTRLRGLAPQLHSTANALIESVRGSIDAVRDILAFDRGLWFRVGV